MDLMNPQPGEPGYWVEKLRSAANEAEFLSAYVEHKKELEKLGGKLRPFDVLAQRLLGRFGQYGIGGEDDPDRELAIFVLKEAQRYFVLMGINHVDGFSASSAVKKRTIAEAEADFACAVSTLMGFARSSAERSQLFDADEATPDARKVAATIDLGCTEEDDHDPAPCGKCEAIRLKVAKAIDAALHEEELLKRLASRQQAIVMMDVGESLEDAQERAKDQTKEIAAARRELEARKERRDEVIRLPEELDGLGDYSEGLPPGCEED